MLRKYGIKAIERRGVRNFEALLILSVFKKKCDMFLYKKGSHVKFCFILLNSFIY